MILILGRFQPLHKGHGKVIQEAYSEDKDLVIAIGSSQKKGDKRNPFGAEERKRMLKSFLISKGIKANTVLIPDIPSDERYVEHCNMYIGRKPDKVVTENEWTERLYREKGYPVEKTQRYYGISSTEIRKAMAEGREWRDKVPRAVVVVLEDIKAEERIKELFKSKDCSELEI